MENAAEALKMVAAVLVFVLALSISINAFGEARQSVQIALNYRDRDYDEDTYLANNNGSTERIVGLETIIPSIYKAYKENYKIVFDKNTRILDKEKGLYQRRDRDGNYIPVFSIDLEKDVLGNDAQKEEFIQAILYGANDDTKNKFEKNLGVRFSFDENEGIYAQIKNNRYQFIEKLGVYYQEEVQGQSETPEANKTRKRVVTYTDYTGT